MSQLLFLLCLVLVAQTTSFAQNEVHLNFEQNETLSEKKIRAKLVSIIDGNANDSSWIGLDYHGRSSSLHAKKSYEFEFRDHNNSEIKRSIFGMDTGDDFILTSLVYDGSYMRNTLVFELWKSLGYWSPDYRYVSLYINDDYQGMYLLCEKIKVGANRVNMRKRGETGQDFLIKKGRFHTNDFHVRSGHFTSEEFVASLGFKSIYPKAKKMNYTVKALYNTYLENISNCIKNCADSNDLASDCSMTIDYDSFIDYFLISEISKNPDAYIANLYIKSESDEEGNSTVSIGPQWDYDLAFSNTNTEFYKTDSNWVYIHNSLSIQPATLSWWNTLTNSEAYKHACLHRLEAISWAFSNAKIEQICDSLRSEFSSLHKADSLLWKTDSSGLPDNIRPHESLDSEVAHLIQFFDKRLAWVSNHLSVLPKFNSPGRIFMQKTGGRVYPTAHNKLEIHNPPYSTSGRYARSGYYTFEIYDPVGNLLQEGTLGNQKIYVNLSSLKKGKHFIHIQEHNGYSYGGSKDAPTEIMPTYSDVYFYENSYYSFEVK